MNNYRITIAGVSLTVSGDCPDGLFPLNSLYLPFISDSLRKIDSVTCQIIVADSVNSDVTGLEVLFDSLQAWVIYRRSQKYLLVFYSPASRDEIIWAAEFDRECSVIYLYLSPVWYKNPFPVINYPLDQILIMVCLSNRKGVLMHGAGAGVNGRGMIFAGKAGQGKSTFAGLVDGSGAGSVLSDERVAVRKVKETFRVFGTPWYSDAGLSGNDDEILSGIFCLHHGTENRIEPVGLKYISERLLPVMSIPWYDRNLFIPLLELYDEIVRNVPVYDFYFKPDSGAVNELCSFIDKEMQIDP